ncbi:MAG: hypothetical protein ACK4TA_16705 [Saprospiraceae bacterium]
MQKFVSTLLLIFFSLVCSTQSYAIVAPAPQTADMEVQQQRFQKRMQQIKAKLEKKLFKKKAAPPEIWDNDRFRLGVLALAAALALALIAGLGILSGFFGFLAGLAAVIGIILIVWALVDY